MKQKYQSDEKWNKFVHKTDGLFGGFWHTTDNKHYFLADYHYKYFQHYSKGCKKKYLLQEVLHLFGYISNNMYLMYLISQNVFQLD